MMALPEKIAPGIFRVDALPFKYAISVLLVAERDGWTLIDTGVPGSVGRITGALNALGAEPADLRRVYLTHHHGDHIGGLSGLIEWAPAVEVIAPEREAPIIGGEQPPDRREHPLMRFLDERQQMPVNPVARTVREGDIIAEFRVIATPGHTLGHTSLLHEGHGLLMTADAFGQLVVPLGQVRVGAARLFCTDPAQAKRSAEKLVGYDFATAVLSHGQPLRDRARERLREATARCAWA